MGQRLPWILFAVTTVAFALTAAYRDASGDVVTTNVSSWQLATGTRPYFVLLDFPALEDHPGRDVWVILDADGREIIGRSAGPVLLAVPAYLVAVRIMGMDAFSLVPGAITAAVAMGASMAIFAITVRPWLGSKNTVLATLALAFGTPVWSVAANGVWPQTVTVLGLSAMAWAASRGRWWLAGAFGGVALWGRVQAAVIVALVGLALAGARKDAKVAVRMAVTSGGALGLLLVWSFWMYGSWNPTAYYNPVDVARYRPDGLFDPINQLGSWVSPDRGILVWTPTLFFLLPVLARHWRTVPDWSRTLAIGGVAYTVLEAMLIEFPGGDTFYGYRMTLELLICLAPAVAVAATHMGRLASTLLAPLLALQVIAVTTGAVNEQLGLPVTEVWRQNSFASVAFYDSRVCAVTLLLALGIGVLGRRIWMDPGLSTRGAASAAPGIGG